jgi:hypothetical protein
MLERSATTPLSSDDVSWTRWDVKAPSSAQRQSLESSLKLAAEWESIDSAPPARLPGSVSARYQLARRRALTGARTNDSPSPLAKLMLC